jgi:hypothetical protein
MKNNIDIDEGTVDRTTSHQKGEYHARKASERPANGWESTSYSERGLAINDESAEDRERAVSHVYRECQWTRASQRWGEYHNR